MNSINKESLILQEFKNKYKALDNENIENNIEKISLFLEKIFENNITVESILSNNELRNKNYKGFYTIEIQKQSYEIEILKWYVKLTNNLPLPFTLLICTYDTSIEELTSFLYRALYCEYNILFFLQNIEDLPNEQRKIIISMLRNKKIINNMKSSLIISFYSQNDDICKSIIKLEGHKVLKEVGKGMKDSDIEKNIEKLINKVYTVSSNSSGVGKTFYIKSKAKTDNLNYLYFPIGGSYNKEDVIKRLNQLNNEIYLDKTLLHLDISETDNDYLTREIIFSFAILYKYGHNDNTVCLSKDLFLYIEIPYGFSDFKERFEILKKFKKIELKIENLPKLNENSFQEENNNVSDVQIVASVLDLFDNNLIEGTNLDINSIPKMNIDKCERLIRKYFNMKNPNYYQIATFIRVMSYQCKNFLESAYVSIEEVKEHNLLNIRHFMVDALIKK